MKYCIYTQIKDEQEYLDEWIQYHLDLGINYIFIVEDIGSTSHKEICNKYNNVEVHPILDIYDKCERPKIEKARTYQYMQNTFLRHSLDYIKKYFDFDWVFYIDTDEFLTFENNNYNLDNIFSEFNDKQVLVLQWQNYNANGHIYKPNGNVLDNYTTKCKFIKFDEAKKGISKEAFNMHLYDKENMKFNHHIPIKANWCKTNGSTDLSEYVYDKLYVRHYITKSFEEYIKKIYIRGIPYNVRNIQNFFELNNDISKNNMNIKKIIQLYNIKI